MLLKIKLKKQHFHNLFLYRIRRSLDLQTLFTNYKSTRKKTKVPPIEYNIVTDVLDQKADITVGDLITTSPALRRKLAVACCPKRVPVTQSPSQQKNTMAVIEEEDINTTAVYLNVSIGDKMVKVLIDCGTGKTCISKSLVNALNLAIDPTSESVFGLETEQNNLSLE